MRFARALAYAMLCGLCLFVLVHAAGDAIIDRHLETSDYLSARAEERARDLQKYVSEHKLASTDAAMLRLWCKEQPLLLMEVFQGDRLVFNSSYYSDEALSDRDIEARYYDWCSYYTVEFSDGTAEILIYCDDEYQLRMVASIVEGVVCFIVAFAVFLLEVRKVARYIRLLSREVQTLESGVLDQPITVYGIDELATLAAGLDSMRTTFLEQRTAEELSYQANQALVTGLSHDLRTPLTKLMLYTEIVRSGMYEDEEQLRGYLTRIDEVASQIRELADSILHYSMASDARAEVARETVGFHDAVWCELEGMADYLGQQGFSIEGPASCPEGNVVVYRPFVRRLMDNIASNITRYADCTQSVRVTCIADGAYLRVSVHNAIAEGASSDESLGIGHVNIATMMEAMGGQCETRRDAGAFEIALLFLRAEG